MVQRQATVINGIRGRANPNKYVLEIPDMELMGAACDLFINSYIRIIGTGRAGPATHCLTRHFTVAAGRLPGCRVFEYVVTTDVWKELSVPGLGVVTGPPVVQNGICYFPQGDFTAIRKMQMDYTAVDDHAFASETASYTNKAYFLETAYDSAKGEPNIWRANQSETTGSTPNGKASSVSRASSSPGAIPVLWTADLNFALSPLPILCGVNTNLVTNIYEHENSLYVMKEDGLYIVQNDRAIRVRLGGSEVAPDVDNGRAMVTGPDKNLYISFRNDVYLLSGGGAYSTGIMTNMPSSRSGTVYSMVAAEGWIFAAINGGTNNYSSIMKYSNDTKTWSEQLDHTFRVDDSNLVAAMPETRPRL
jgi:hypothetical protein